MIRYTDYSNKNIVNCGHSVQDAPLDNLYKYSRHFHESGEMLLLIKGDVQYSIDGERYILKPYDVLLIPPTKYHFLIPMSNEEYECYVINLKMDFVGDERLKKLFSPPYVINIAGDKAIRRMFELLDFYFENFTLEDFKEASYHIISAILIYLSNKSKNDIDSRAAESDPLITKITAFIDKNLESELDVAVLARHLNFSESYVQNRFSKVMGIGLKQYINRKKIYAAHIDIMNGMSPNQAAQKYCFADYSGFFRHYKRILGISPKEDRGRAGGELD